MFAILKVKRTQVIFAGVLLITILAAVFYFLSTKPARSPYNFTDGNWEAGVSRSEVGFFVENSRANAKTFKVGLPIEFASGERQIISVVVLEPYLNIYLAGSKLDPSSDGYPNTFKIGKVTNKSSDTPFSLTDANWQAGVSRVEVGFFIENNSFNIDTFKVGTRLQFASGERDIINVVISETFLNIYLSGEKLDPLTDGHPNVFKIIKTK
jgi:hypothetical protein